MCAKACVIEYIYAVKVKEKDIGYCTCKVIIHFSYIHYIFVYLIANTSIGLQLFEY